MQQPLRPVLALALAFSLANLMGCGLSPEKMCRKFIEADAKAKDRDASAKEVDKAVERCTEKQTKTKSLRPERYKCESKCIDKNDEASAMKKCMRDC